MKVTYLRPAPPYDYDAFPGKVWRPVVDRIWRNKADGTFHYADETERFVGPYPSEADATRALNVHILWLTDTPRTGPPAPLVPKRIVVPYHCDRYVVKVKYQPLAKLTTRLDTLRTVITLLKSGTRAYTISVEGGRRWSRS